MHAHVTQEQRTSTDDRTRGAAALCACLPERKNLDQKSGRRPQRRRAWDQRDGTQCKLVVYADFFKIIFFMINYKFRSCYKKIDIYKSVGCSMVDRGPVGSSLADRHVLLNAMLLCRRACYCSGARGASRDKFMGQKCIFKVQGPAVHHVTSLDG
jgi:hypothetical protein